MGRVPELRFPEFSGEWREVKLGEISRVIGGGTPSTSVSEYWNGAIPWFTPTEIKSKYCEDSKRTITNSGLKNSSAKLLPKGTILLTTRATIGECCIAKQECTTNQGFQNIVAIDGKSYNVFLYYLLLTIKRELLKRSNGSTFLEISGIEVKKLKISIPSLPEQQKIADFLSAVDEKMAILTDKITRLEAYKKGMMQKLLSGELRFPGFTDEWREVKLGEIATFVKDKIDTQEIDVYSYISTENILQDYAGIVPSSKPPSVSRVTKFKKGDILISNIRPYLKKIWMAAIEGGASSDVIVLRAKEAIKDGFLSTQLMRDRFIGYVMSGAKGVKMPRGDVKQIAVYTLYIPSLPEQQKIADFLTAIDDKLTLEKERLEALKRYKQGLLQKMFV